MGFSHPYPRLVEQEMIETDALRHCRLIQKMV